MVGVVYRRVFLLGSIVLGWTIDADGHLVGDRGQKIENPPDEFILEHMAELQMRGDVKRPVVWTPPHSEPGLGIISYATQNLGEDRGHWATTEWTACENQCGVALRSRQVECDTSFGPECSTERPPVEIIDRCYPATEAKRISYCDQCESSGGCSQCAIGFEWDDSRGACVNNVGFAKVTLIVVCDECDLREVLANSVSAFADHEDLKLGINVFPIDVRLSVGVTLSNFRRLTNHATVEIGFLISSSNPSTSVRSQVVSVSTVAEKLKETLHVQQAGYELFDQGLVPTMWPQTSPLPPSVTPVLPATHGGHTSYIIDSIGICLVVGVALCGVIWYCKPKPAPAKLDGGVSPYSEN